mmetsp:Transcript_19541/g.40276  ORF Transcript_19541/g.40276 Transcript_19541/m.40276 type:complete len:200 (-) Transcript_19541:730-1329(-)
MLVTMSWTTSCPWAIAAFILRASIFSSASLLSFERRSISAFPSWRISLISSLAASSSSSFSALPASSFPFFACSSNWRSILSIRSFFCLEKSLCCFVFLASTSRFEVSVTMSSLTIWSSTSDCCSTISVMTSLAFLRMCSICLFVSWRWVSMIPIPCMALQSCDCIRMTYVLLDVVVDDEPSSVEETPPLSTTLFMISL